MHTTDVKFQNKDNVMNDGALKTYEESDLKEKKRNTNVLDFNEDTIKGVNSPDFLLKEHCEKTEEFSMMNVDKCDIPKHAIDVSLQEKNFLEIQEDYAGVVWDVFRRQDIPRLNEYIRHHAEELNGSANPSSTSQVIFNK